MERSKVDAKIGKKQGRGQNKKNSEVEEV